MHVDATELIRQQSFVLLPVIRLLGRLILVFALLVVLCDSPWSHGSSELYSPLNRRSRLRRAAGDDTDDAGLNPVSLPAPNVSRVDLPGWSPAGMPLIRGPYTELLHPAFRETVATVPPGRRDRRSGQWLGHYPDELGLRGDHPGGDMHQNRPSYRLADHRRLCGPHRRGQPELSETAQGPAPGRGDDPGRGPLN